MSQAYQEVPEWLEQVAEEAIGSSYGPAGGRFASKDTRQVINVLYDSIITPTLNTLYVQPWPK